MSENKSGRPRTRDLPRPGTWAAQVRAWRKDNGMSQELAAQVLGVSMRTYQNWEGGEAEVCVLSPAQMREIVRRDLT